MHTVTYHTDCGRSDPVLVDRPRRQVALVTLNRPERMNSMAFDVTVPLKRVLEELTHDNSTRTVGAHRRGPGLLFRRRLQVRGSGAARRRSHPAEFALRSMEVLDDVILGLRRMHQPVIAR